jgi:hypothetical protein
VRGRAFTALVAAALLGAGAAPARAAEIQLAAELSPDPVGMRELATFSLLVTSDGADLPEIEPGFLLDNLEIVRGPMRSMSHSWVNGESSSSLQLVWQLKPKALGRARVHSISVTAGGQAKAVPEAAILVVAEPPPGREPATRDEPLDPFSRFLDEDPLAPFRRRQRPTAAQPEVQLRALAEPATAWIGQQVVWRLVLDTQTDITGFQPRNLPDFAGFWARELPRADRPRPEWVEIGGKRFGRVPMIERALFPLRAGKLHLDGVGAVVVARIADADWFGRLSQDEPLRRASNAVDVEVRALPPAPRGFTGVVGETALDAEVEAGRPEAGGALSYLVRARSTGNLRGVTAPALDLPTGLRSFPPATETEEKIVGDRLQTTLTWRYVILADEAGSYTLPPVSLSYFDPVSSSYAVAASSPLTVRVGQRSSAAPAPVSPPPPPADTVGRKGAPETGRASGVTPGLEGVAIGSAALVTLVVASLLVLRRRRSRPAARQLRDALAHSRASTSPRAAAGELEEAWRRFLEARHGLGRGLPVGHWADFLAARGVDAEDSRELAALFEEMHLLAYAPELADAEALRADLFDRSRRLLRRLA